MRNSFSQYESLIAIDDDNKDRIFHKRYKEETQCRHLALD